MMTERAEPPEPPAGRQRVVAPAMHQRRRLGSVLDGTCCVLDHDGQWSATARLIAKSAPPLIEKLRL
jgi:hypothetical protein